MPAAKRPQLERIVTHKQRQIDDEQKLKYSRIGFKTVESVVQLSIDLFNYITGNTEFGKYELVNMETEFKIEKHSGEDVTNLTHALYKFFGITETRWNNLFEKYKDYVIEVTKSDGLEEVTVGEIMSRPKDIIEARIVDGSLKYRYSDKASSLVLKAKHQLTEAPQKIEKEHKLDNETLKALADIKNAINASNKLTQEKKAEDMAPIDVQSSYKAPDQKWPELRSQQKQERKRKLNTEIG